MARGKDRSASTRENLHGEGFRLTPRQLLAGVLGILAIVLIALNNDSTEVSLIFFSKTMPLWIVLTLTTLIGIGIGMLVGARRTKRKYMNVE